MTAGQGREGSAGPHVEFTQSGGFAGLVKGCTLDAAAMEAETRAEFERLVAGSGLEASCEALSPSARDRKRYSIAITRSGTTVTVVCDDATLPPEARDLLAYLAARARPVTPR